MKSEHLIKFENPVLGEMKGYIDEKGGPWFLAGNVCRCLGLKNSRKVIDDIAAEHELYHDHIKGVTISYPLIQSEGGRQKTCAIKENILYEIIFKSRKEKAFMFRQWVFKEVLPALRKHGEYRMNGKLIRRSLTDAIKSEVIPKIENPTKNKIIGAYSNYSALINKSLGLSSKVDRNTLSDEVLEKIAKKENLVTLLIQDGKSYNQIKEIIIGA